jgi:predicted alpha/beta hydrolase family esterase
MLARLQQALTLGAGALALLWALWCWRTGHPGWAVAGVLLVLFGHAVVLGLEFVFLSWAHGPDDPTPRASAGQLLRAWWAEVRAAPAVFCWRQPFRSRLWPDLLPPPGVAGGPAGGCGQAAEAADAAGAHPPRRRGVLLVHGFVCNRGLWNPWLQRLTARSQPFVAVNLEPVFGSIDDYIGILEDAARRLEHATGCAPVVVAHSMGGLAVRRWLAEQGGPERVHRVISIGTPHRGTWLARFAMTRNARQMQQLSHWLQTLAARESAAHRQRFTCFYSHCDNIVFPPATATLQGADNRHLSAVPHVQMADRPEPWQALLGMLEEPAIAAPCTPAAPQAARAAAADAGARLPRQP